MCIDVFHDMERNMSFTINLLRFHALLPKAVVALLSMTTIWLWFWKIEFNSSCFFQVVEVTRYQVGPMNWFAWLQVFVCIYPYHEHSWTNLAWCFSNVFISPHVAWSESIKPGNWQATIPRTMHRFYFGTWFPKCVPSTRAACARFFWNNSQEANSWLFWRWPTWLVEIIKRSRLKIPEWVFEHQSDWHRTPPVFLSQKGAGEAIYLWVSLYLNFT